jgi:hypothetical protein
LAGDWRSCRRHAWRSAGQDEVSFGLRPRLPRGGVALFRCNRSEGHPEGRPRYSRSSGASPATYKGRSGPARS